MNCPVIFYGEEFYPGSAFMTSMGGLARELNEEGGLLN